MKPYKSLTNKQRILRIEKMIKKLIKIVQRLKIIIKEEVK